MTQNHSSRKLCCTPFHNIMDTGKGKLLYILGHYCLKPSPTLAKPES